MSIKNKFGIPDLKTEYAFSQHIKLELNNGAFDKEAFGVGVAGSCY